MGPSLTPPRDVPCQQPMHQISLRNCTQVVTGARQGADRQASEGVLGDRGRMVRGTVVFVLHGPSAGQEWSKDDICSI